MVRSPQFRVHNALAVHLQIISQPIHYFINCLHTDINLNANRNLYSWNILFQQPMSFILESKIYI